MCWMNSDLAAYVQECIDNDSLIKFYQCRAWKRLRQKVLERDRATGCAECAKRGRYSRATHVHHVMHVRVRPDLAMSEHYIDGEGEEQRNLVSVCHPCHETVCHPERLLCARSKEPLTRERW